MTRRRVQQWAVPRALRSVPIRLPWEAVVVVLLCGVTALVQAVAGHQRTLTLLVFGVVEQGLTLGAAWAAVGAARRTAGWTRRGWRLLVVACGLWSLGSLLYLLEDLGWAAFVVDRVSDLSYVAFGLVAIASSLAHLLGRARPQVAARAVLDGLLMGSATMTVVWALWAHGTIETFDGQTSEAIIHLTLPVLGVTAFSMAVSALWYGTASGTSLLVAAGSGFLAISIAGDSYAVLANHRLNTGGLTDFTTFVGLGLLASAGLRCRPVEESATSARDSGWILYLPPVALAPAWYLSAERLMTSLDPVLVSAAGFLAVLALTRQVLVTSDHRGALRQLEVQHRTLDRVAHVDPLTGLENRRSFGVHVEAAVRAALTDDVPFAVGMVDLNHFKVVNDTLGHHTGDELLVEVARRLAGCFRDGDHVARWGGDEFAFLVPHWDGDPTELVARVHRALEGPVRTGAGELQASASVGAERFGTDSAWDCWQQRARDVTVPHEPRTGSADADVEDVVTAVLGKVDEQMYVAKRAHHSAPATGATVPQAVPQAVLQSVSGPRQ